jgi:hypothetical protein
MKHFFIDEKTGKLFVIPEMPEKPFMYDVWHKPGEVMSPSNRRELSKYQSDLQSAKAKAVEVDNQHNVFEALWKSDPDTHNPISFYNWKYVILPKKSKDTIYSLECEVDRIKVCAHESCPVDAGCDKCAEPKELAFITFPQLEKKEESTEESQDSVWDDLIKEWEEVSMNMQSIHILPYLKSKFHVSRKPQTP